MQKKQGYFISYFTFHNVSINTWVRAFWAIPRPSLHSTMFLLIPDPPSANFCRFIFTFHNVSINTWTTAALTGNRNTLHSTMFLLIPQAAKVETAATMTLHSTMFLLNTGAATYETAVDTLHSTMFLLIQISTIRQRMCRTLYIPQCFY